jgi:hypothetical protein
MVYFVINHFVLFWSMIARDFKLAPQEHQNWSRQFRGNLILELLTSLLPSNVHIYHSRENCIDHQVHRSLYRVDPVSRNDLMLHDGHS